jgi:hypothetical protein
MRSRIVAAFALSAALVVPAALAQQSGDQSQPAQPAAATDQSSQQVEVTGKIVTLTADRIDVKVASVTAPEGTAAGSTVMVGQTSSFVLDSSSQLAQGLKAGDKVDLWFTNSNGSMLASRVALAVGGDQPAGTSESGASSQSPSATSTSSSSSSSSYQSSSENASQNSSDQSAMGATASASENGSSASEQAPAAAPAAAQGAHRANLPKTGSPLPLIGLVGLVALASVLVLRFVVRV